MFLQRKTIAVKYDDALDTLDGDENKLKHLITFGIIVQTGDSLELDDAYQRFYEASDKIILAVLNLPDSNKYQ